MHHKMAFFEGGKGRHIKLFHDRHAKLLSNIYNLYTFDDLEKKTIICDKPKKPVIFNIL